MVSQSRILLAEFPFLRRKWIHKKLHVIFSSKPVLGCGSSWEQATVILIYIVAAILSETVFLVDESSWSSIKFKSPLNATVSPYVPGCLLWLFQFLPCSSISLKANRNQSKGTSAVFFAQFEYHFWGENDITLKASKIVNFIIECFKLRKRRFQMINYITRI